MSAKGLIGMVVLGMILLAFNCQGAYQIVPIWKYNVSLDFGGENVTIEQLPTASNINSITRSFMFRGNSTDDWGAIYLFNIREPSRMVPEDKLRSILMPTCKRIQADHGTISGLKSIIATADARVEHGFGQRCYGGMATLSPLGVGEVQYLAIIGHFTNESLNENLVKTAKITYTG